MKPVIAAPAVDVGDEVFFRRGSGTHLSGRVVAHGKDGFTAKSGDQSHQVKWPNYVGHKKRVNHRVALIDQGEDGALGKLPDGRVVFIKDPGETVQKSRVLFFVGR